jgi:hypothetical protein
MERYCFLRKQTLKTTQVFFNHVLILLYKAIQTVCEKLIIDLSIMHNEM